MQIFLNNRKNNVDTNLKFEDVRMEIFPIYSYFNKINKKKPQNLIKFNIGNE